MIRSAAYLLAIMLVAGWPAAGTPFRGDQVVYALTARRMAEGAVLYRDVWDVTNPGVFWFYQLGGTLFGFTEDGVHLFEWLWWVTFAFAVSFAAKRQFGLASLPLAPAGLIGTVYYLTATSDPNFLTRAEGLVGFPLFVTAYAACRAAGGGTRATAWAALAGVAGGVAILFKSAFGLCVGAAWVIPFVLAIRSRSAVRFVAGVAGGLAIALAPAAGWFAAKGAWAEFVDAAFVLPREILAVTEPATFSRLAASVRRFVEAYSVVLAAAVCGGAIVVRRERDPFVVSMALAMAAGAVVILIQRWSWWDYHFLLIGVPAATVASYCWPDVARVVRERMGRHFGHGETLLLGLAGVVLFVPVLGHGANAFFRIIPHQFGVTPAGRIAARLNAGNAYRIAARETEWLSVANAPPGPVFVAGDPCFLWVSGRPAATRFNGWSLELFPPRLWESLLADLTAAPPAAVFVAHTSDMPYEGLIRERFPAMAEWLVMNYVPRTPTANGTWWVRKHQ